MGPNPSLPWGHWVGTEAENCTNLDLIAIMISMQIGDLCHKAPHRASPGRLQEEVRSQLEEDLVRPMGGGVNASG